MSVKTVYFEKYSIAPSPSRDYYGLKVLDDEVELFHWRISHGPHRIPLTKFCNSNEWTNDKLLQNEIEIIFGKSVLQYIDDILNRRTLLTLPKKFIKKLLNYLSINDIVRLFSLSRTAHKIFNTEFTWKLFCRRIKSDNWTIDDEKYGMAYGWKQLYKETKDIEMNCESNKKLQCKRPNVSSRPLEKSSSYQKLSLRSSQLEISRTVSTNKKITKVNSKMKIEPRIESRSTIVNNVNDDEEYLLNSPDEVSSGKERKFLNIINIEASDIDGKTNIKCITNPKDEKLQKKNILEKKKSSKYSSGSKLNFTAVKKPSESIGLSKSKILDSKYNLNKNSSFTKCDDIALDDLVKNTIGELYKSDGYFNHELNCLDDISSTDEQSIADDSPKNYNQLFLTNEYRTAPKSELNSIKSINKLKSTLNPLQINKEIDELSAWQAAKLKSIKSSKAYQSIASTEKKIQTNSPKYFSRLRKNT